MIPEPNEAVEPCLFYHNSALDDRPALHALLVGVSAYPNLPVLGTPVPAAGWPENTLGLFQLDSAAISALRIARWLIENKDQLTPKLGSVRLLLTASQTEIANPEWPAKLSIPPAAHDELFTASENWRASAARHPDSMTLFYFAGHGVQRQLGDHVLLLHDFGRRGPMLASSLSTQVLFDGMRLTATRRLLARRQLYFFDACNVKPEALKKYEKVDVDPFWSPEYDDKDKRQYGIFYATAPGHLTYANKGGHSLFCEALMRCLEGTAAIEGKLIRPNNPPPWIVTVKSLETALRDALQSSTAAAGVEQILGSSSAGDFPFHTYKSPPKVEIALNIDPMRAGRRAELTFSTPTGQFKGQVGPGIPSCPHLFSLEAGGYICKVAHHHRPPKYTIPDPNPFIFFANPRVVLTIEFQPASE